MRAVSCCFDLSFHGFTQHISGPLSEGTKPFLNAMIEVGGVRTRTVLNRARARELVQPSKPKRNALSPERSRVLSVSSTITVPSGSEVQSAVHSMRSLRRSNPRPRRRRSIRSRSFNSQAKSGRSNQVLALLRHDMTHSPRGDK